MLALPTPLGIPVSNWDQRVNDWAEAILIVGAFIFTFGLIGMAFGYFVMVMTGGNQ